MSEDKEYTTCVWTASEGGEKDCTGEIKVYALFDGILKIPCCEFHINCHKEIMTLHRLAKMSTDEISDMTGEQRRAKLIELDLLDKVEDIEL